MMMFATGHSLYHALEEDEREKDKDLRDEVRA
jgi:hypothetical protein